MIILSAFSVKNIFGWNFRKDLHMSAYVLLVYPLPFKCLLLLLMQLRMQSHREPKLSYKCRVEDLQSATSSREEENYHVLGFIWSTILTGCVIHATVWNSGVQLCISPNEMEHFCCCLSGSAEWSAWFKCRHPFIHFVTAKGFVCQALFRKVNFCSSCQQFEHISTGAAEMQHVWSILTKDDQNKKESEWYSVRRFIQGHTVMRDSPQSRAEFVWCILQ